MQKFLMTIKLKQKKLFSDNFFPLIILKAPFGAFFWSYFLNYIYPPFIINIYLPTNFNF